jgi:hypothetical protein
MNVNMTRDADDNAGFLSAACAADATVSWPGAALWVSIDSGASYNFLVNLTAEATIGVTVNAQANFTGGNIPDEHSYVHVRLSNGSLSSTNHDGLLSGVFCIIVGDEIEFARTATLQANGTYIITGLLRGRRGSEYAMTQHTAGERFILVDYSTLVQVPQVTADIGQNRLYKAVTGDSSLAATTAKSFTNSGARLRPYSCVHLGGGKEANGDWTFKWVPRSRTSGEWRDFVDTPVGEATEAYALDVLDADLAVVRSITGLTSPTATWTEAQQTTDFGSEQTEAYFRVYKLSATVGLGYPAYAHVVSEGEATTITPPEYAPPPAQPPAPAPAPGGGSGAVGPYAISLPAPGPDDGAAPGTTDSNGDATLIALIAGTSGTDIVPPDGIVYVVDAAVAIPSGKNFHAAAGTSVTIKAANGYTGHLLTLTGCINSAVRNITFDGNYANRTAQEGSSSACAIMVSGGSGNSVEYNKFLNTPSFAVWAYSSPGLSIRYNQFEETYHAVRIDGNNLANTGWIEGNDFLNTSAFKSIQHIEAINFRDLFIRHNVRMTGAGLAEPTSHDFEGTWGNSIYLWNFDVCTVENNRAGGNYWSAVVSGQGGTNGVFKRNEFDDGLMTPCAMWIEQAGAEYITTTSNIVNGSIEIGDTGGDHCTITRNRITTSQMAINVNSAAKDILIQYNTMISTDVVPTDRGIYLWDKSTPTGIDCRVLDNTFVGFNNGVEINNPGGVGTVYDITVTGNYFEDCNTIVEIPGGITVDPSCDIQSVSAPAPAPAPVGAITVASLPETILQTATDGDGVAYWVHDNTWGPGSLVRGTYTGLGGTEYEQYIGISPELGASGEASFRVSWKFPTGTTEVKSYPSIVYGAHPGWYNTGSTPGGLSIRLPDFTISEVAPCGPTPGTVLPRQLPLAPLYCSFDWEHLEAPTERGHLSFDIWLQSSATQVNGFGASPLTHEIMIPLTYWGDYGAYGTRNPSWYQHDHTIQGYLFHIYYAPDFNGVWKFVVFEPDSPTDIDPGTLELAEFINYVADQGWATGNEYLMSAELGVEAVEGTGDMRITAEFHD